MDAASVGVANPRKIDPRTEITRSAGRIIVRREINLLPQPAFSSGGSDGPSLGFK
ncbi:hypothetical protein ES703_49430 [subsurface metagenome]